MKALTFLLLGLSLFGGPLSAQPDSVRLALLHQEAEGRVVASPEAVTVGPQDKLRLVVECPPGLQIWVLTQEDGGPFEILAKPGMATSFDEVLGTPSWVFPSRKGWFRPDPQVTQTTLVIFVSPSPIVELSPWQKQASPVASALVSTLMRRAQAGGWSFEGQSDYNGGLRDNGTSLTYRQIPVNGLTSVVYELNRRP